MKYGDVFVKTSHKPEILMVNIQSLALWQLSASEMNHYFLITVCSATTQYKYCKYADFEKSNERDQQLEPHFL